MSGVDKKPQQLSPAEAAEHLVAAVQQLSAVSDLADVIDIVKHAAREIAHADGATFVLREGEQCHYVDEDAIEPLWKGGRFPLDICISGWVMRNRQPVIIPDVFADPRIPHDVYRRTFVKSMAMSPIRSLSPIGAIGIYWREARSPTPAALRWIQSLADSAALAIEHLQARAELAEHRRLAKLRGAEGDDTSTRAGNSAAAATVKMCFITNRFEHAGDWLSLEAFLDKRFGLAVSHGLSPEALQRLDGQSESARLLAELSTTMAK